MATSQRSGRTSRSGSSSNGTKRTPSRSTASRSTGSRSTGSRSTGSRSRPAARARTGAASRSSGSNWSGGRTSSASRQGTSNGSPITKVVAPVASAVLGTAAGILLGRRGARQRKVLGIPVPGQGDGLEKLGKGVAEAGRQFGRLASEVQSARKKAEEIGKALS